MATKIFKKEFDFDVYDLDDKARLDAQLSILREKAAGINDLSQVEGMRAYCQAVFGFFDAVLGEGAAKKIFGGKTNILTCIEAVREFTKEIARRTAEAQKLAAEAMKGAQSPKKA